jgi:putative membrane protein
MTIRRGFALPAGTADPALFGIAALGGLLFWLSAFHPSLMPLWGPWDFSWPEYLATAFGMAWFFRGLARTPAAMRPPPWRQAAFVGGVLAIYAVLQTRFDYMAQHMFFLNRVQHVAMHHLGPFLIALAWPGVTLRRGAPESVVRVATNPWVIGAVRTLQQPLLAAVLFVGLFFLWLVPPVHVRAMLDPLLYAVMNWSMVIDGLLFWCLVLDPRPAPPARVSCIARAALAFAVMVPQVLLGAVLAFAPHDLYPYYDLCGRLIPSLGGLADQRIGALVSWIFPVMMSTIGTVWALRAYLRDEEAGHQASRNSSANTPGGCASSTSRLRSAAVAARSAVGPSAGSSSRARPKPSNT